MEKRAELFPPVITTFHEKYLKVIKFFFFFIKSNNNIFIYLTEDSLHEASSDRLSGGECECQ